MALASNAPLSIKNNAGINRDIAFEIDYNDTGTKSLLTLGETAGLYTDHISILDFLGYSYTYTIYIIKKTFGQRQIMNCIENIGFPNPVITHKTVYLWRKLKLV